MKLIPITPGPVQNNLYFLFVHRFQADDSNLPHEEGTDTYVYNVGICATAEKGQSEESLVAVTQHHTDETNPGTTVLGRYNDTRFMSGSK